MVRVLGVLLVVGSIATAGLYAEIFRRIEAQGRVRAPVARAALAVATAVGAARPLAAATAPAPPERLPRPRPQLPVDEALLARAVARAERLAVPKLVRGAFFYVVEPGDWVEDLSRRFGVPLEVILDVNGISRDELLRPGDALCLPIIEYTPRVGLASWYGPGFDHRPGANGAIFHQDQVSVAALHYPFDLRMEVERRDNRRRVTVQVWDRGPYYDGRILDLSRAAASALESEREGVVEVVATPLNRHLAAIEHYRTATRAAVAKAVSAQRDL